MFNINEWSIVTIIVLWNIPILPCSLVDDAVRSNKIENTRISIKYLANTKYKKMALKNIYSRPLVTMHWQGMCALKPSVVRICKDTHNQKPTWCELLSPIMQRHNMVVAMLSLGIMIEKRQHEWEDVTTAESLQLVTGPTMAGKNTQNYVPSRFLCAVVELHFERDWLWPSTPCAIVLII